MRSVELPEPFKSQMAAMMALRDLEVERGRANRLLEDSNKLYELRGWLRLCEDNPVGHAEFYRWACHYIFGDPAPEETLTELTGDDVPYHLRSDAPPVAVCDRCHRQTWQAGVVGTIDRLSQPDGSPCGGHFVAA